MKKYLYDRMYAEAVSELFMGKIKENEMRLESVAKSIGIKYNTLFRYLDGSRQIPLDIFQKLCQHLGLDFVETFQLTNQIATEKTLKEFKG